MPTIPVSDETFIEMHRIKQSMMETAGESLDWNTIVEMIMISYLKEVGAGLPVRLLEKHPNWVGHYTPANACKKCGKAAAQYKGVCDACSAEIMASALTEAIDNGELKGQIVSEAEADLKKEELAIAQGFKKPLKKK